MVSPQALQLDDDDTATDDVVAICLRLAVLQYDLISKPETFTGMESSIQVSMITKFCLQAEPSTPVHFCHTVDARSDHPQWRWLPQNWLFC
ncbi:hypothetical protein TNCT_567591 [Trichonephila clavata]|uniref:Uncharacterized protein n=1 Tax=Trichonephila clavata TaxID=2740835 RepID=A0A8X6F684_TRICU|nr:hypothetical protein TNCT_567591 [Trichonephila clavata]